MGGGVGGLDGRGPEVRIGGRGGGGCTAGRMSSVQFQQIFFTGCSTPFGTGGRGVSLSVSSCGVPLLYSGKSRYYSHDVGVSLTAVSVILSHQATLTQLVSH